MEITSNGKAKPDSLPNINAAHSTESHDARDWN
jgi:hypothetical protein